MPPGRRICMSEEDKRAKKAAFQRLKVYLKTQFGRWREFRAAKGLISDDQVAKFLLDWYEASSEEKTVSPNDDQPLDLSLKSSQNRDRQPQQRQLYLPLREKSEQKPRLPTPDDCKWYPQQASHFAHSSHGPNDTVLRNILQQPAVKRTCHTPPSLQESLSLHQSRDHHGELPHSIYQRSSSCEEKSKQVVAVPDDIPENLSTNETEDDSESSSSSSSGGEITSCSSQLSTDSSPEDEKSIPLTPLGRKPMQLFPFKPKIESSFNVPGSGLVARDTRLQRHLRLQNLNQEVPRRVSLSAVKELGGIDDDVDKEELINALGLYRKYVSQPRFMPNKVNKRPIISQDESCRRSFRQKRKKVYHEYSYDYEEQISNLCNVDDPETWISEFTEMDLEDERSNCLKEERISPTQEKENCDVQICKSGAESNMEDVKPKDLSKLLKGEKCKKKKKKSHMKDLQDKLELNIKTEPMDSVEDGVVIEQKSKKKPTVAAPKKKNTSKKPCPVCGKLVCSFGFKPHMRSHQSATEHKCKECGFVTSVLSNLIRHHTQLHEQDMGEVLCNQCGKRFWNKLRYAHHYKITHMTPSEFQCPKCDKSFKDRHRLRHHDMAVHLQIRTRECTWEGCGKVFKTTHHLIQHYRLHTGEKPYRCKHCDYSAAQQNSVNYHMKSKHGIPVSQRSLKQTYDDLDVGAVTHVTRRDLCRRKSDPGWRDLPQEMMDNFSNDVVGIPGIDDTCANELPFEDDLGGIVATATTSEASLMDVTSATDLTENSTDSCTQSNNGNPNNNKNYNNNNNDYNNNGEDIFTPNNNLMYKPVATATCVSSSVDEANPSSVMESVRFSSVMEARKPHLSDDDDEEEEEPGEIRVGENFCQELYEILKLGNAPF